MKITLEELMNDQEWLKQAFDIILNHREEALEYLSLLEIEDHVKKRRKDLINKIIDFFNQTWCYKETGEQALFDDIVKYSLSYEGTADQFIKQIKKGKLNSATLLRYYQNLYNERDYYLNDDQ